MGRTPSARVRLCGSLEVELHGQRLETELPARQGRLLFALLVLMRGRPAQREELIDALWPESAPAAPGAALNAVLSRLRRTLGPALQSRGGPVRLALGEDAWVDVEVAAGAVRRARAALAAGTWRRALDAAREAVELLDGELLPGLHAICLDDPRRSVRELRAEALEQLASAGLECGADELLPAEQAARELIALAPFHETGYRLLMHTHEARGNVAEALQVYDLLRCLLREELGSSPSGDLRSLHARLLSRSGEAAPASYPLPPPPQRFAGREGELERLRGAWQRAAGPRVVAVHGEPGSGKTALLLRFAHELRAERATVLYGRCRPDAPPCHAIAAALAGRRWLPDSSDGAAVIASGLEHLRALGREAPLALVLDDLEHVDRATLLLVERLVGTAGGHPSLVLCAYRDTAARAGHPVDDALAALRRDGLAEAMPLGGLDTRAAGELATALGVHDAGALYVRTAGNPFLLTELARAEAHGPLPDRWQGDRPRLPKPIVDAVQRRLAELDDPTRRYLEAAATLGTAFDPNVAAAVARLKPAPGLDALDASIAAGLVGEPPGGACAFTSDTVREAVEAGMSNARRSALRAAAERVGGRAAVVRID